MRLVPLVVALSVGLASVARAEPVQLRIATVIPEGTGWARELNAWARDIDAATHGSLRIKIYFSGIAGEEEAVLERIRREQLDGAIGSDICSKVAPSLRALRLTGVFDNARESAAIDARLRPAVNEEFLHAGFLDFGSADLGSELLFSRVPVRDLASMRKLRWWVWASDDALPAQLRALGLTVVQTPITEAARAFESGKFDGFITLPTAALAFQWTTQVRYLTQLPVSFRTGCLIVATRAFDPLPSETKQAFTDAAGRLDQRVEELGRRENAELVGGLLAKQGLTSTAAPTQLRREYYEAVRVGRPGLKAVPEQILAEVLRWLNELRGGKR